MKALFFARWFGVALLPVWLGTAVAEPATEAPAPEPQAEAPKVGSWHVREVDGVEYLPMEDLRSFYKLMPLQPKGRRVAGQRLLGNGEVTLAFGPAPRELRIQERLCILAYPVLEDSSGDLLVSKVDVLQLIEPVLRPTYIVNRSAVRTVVIDPGHGGHDTGTVTPYAREADVALVVSTKLGAELRKRGFEVVYTQEQNQYLSPQGRVDKANATPAAIFVSLHLNSGRSDMKGAQTYTLTPCGKNEPPLPGHEFSQCSMALAMALQSSLVEKAGAADGGCRRAHYSLLNSLRCPAVMVEMGYATNPEEGTRLASEEYQIKLANALAAGVEAFARVMNPGTALQVQKAPVVETPPPSPVKVDPAPPKKTQPARRTQPRQKAPRRRATPAPKKKSAPRKPAPKRNSKRRR
jgi:N-acetylmuramoyl-L-alanine amidase